MGDMADVDVGDLLDFFAAPDVLLRLSQLVVDIPAIHEIELSSRRRPANTA